MKACLTICLLCVCLGMATYAEDVWDYVEGTWQQENQPVSVVFEKTRIIIRTEDTEKEEVWDIVGGTNRPARLTVKKDNKEEVATYTRDREMIFRLGNRTWMLRLHHLTHAPREDLSERRSAQHEYAPRPKGSLVEIASLDATNITHLSCSENILTNLLSHSSELILLCCNKTRLATLDLSHNPLLTKLYCEQSCLTNLDLSHNPNLVYLQCSDSRMRSLDISHCPNLITLWCHNTSLTDLDISSNKHLQNINLKDNRLLTNIVVWWNPTNKPPIDLQHDGRAVLTNP